MFEYFEHVITVILISYLQIWFYSKLIIILVILEEK